eukprot:GHUV01026826.1.p1 GENE.GHUV01026826.1~~GHUV01026826.1.p1  ORF type:complete len:177 (+),score=51.92 GHUV01026826.1:225-755(+)
MMLQRQCLSGRHIGYSQQSRPGSSVVQLVPRTPRLGVHARSRRVHVHASSDADDIMAKYGITAASGSSSKPVVRQQASTAAAPLAKAAGNGVFILLLLNVVLFVLDHVLHLKGIQMLYLNHVKPQWWQWITHAFCHANWQHLSMNLFNLCVFGKMVEETEGAAGLIFAYLITAVGV